MNVKVEEFLNLKKDEEKKRRDEHLVSLGLVDESKTVRMRKYSRFWSEEYEQYDGDKDMYFCEKNVHAPLEVTDEEYKEILKYAPQISEKTKMKPASGFKWGNVIKVIAIISLFLGLIANLFMFVVGFDLWECVGNIIIIFLFFPFVMGFSRIVSAAEKYLRKE